MSDEQIVESTVPTGPNVPIARLAEAAGLNQFMPDWREQDQGLVSALAQFFAINRILWYGGGVMKVGDKYHVFVPDQSFWGKYLIPTLSTCLEESQLNQE